MEHMRKLNFRLIGKVEVFIHRPPPLFGFRRDLFGWMDVLALGADGLWYGVQSCAMSGRAAHLEKLGAPDLAQNIAAWMENPCHRAELWSWRKLLVKRGGVAVRWEVERTPLLLPTPDDTPTASGSRCDRPQAAGLF